MKLTSRIVRVATARPFRIATGTTTEHVSVVCELRHGDVTGLGEASPSRRVTGETVDSVEGFLARMAPEVEALRPDDWEAFLDRIHAEHPKEPTARCALDLAVHDLVGKLRGVPARELYGVPAGRLETCMTVSLDEPSVMADEARGYRARGFRAIKLKLGDADRDAERVRAVQDAVPDAKLRADANTGWSYEEAASLTKTLADLGVEFVEQPFTPDRDADHVRIARESPVTLYLDESVKDVADVRRLAGLGFRGGVNLKLMKTGGLRPAIVAARAAREAGFPLQLGCNVETGIGISAGAQLLSLLDHADLDGNLLLAKDPFEGPRPVDGVLEAPRGPGLGLGPGA